MLMKKEDKGEEIKRRDETTKNGPPPHSRKYILLERKNIFGQYHFKIKYYVFGLLPNTSYTVDLFG